MLLLLQGRLDIAAAEVAPSACMPALQRPLIYRGNGNNGSVLCLYRHGMLQPAIISVVGGETEARERLERGRYAVQRTTLPTRGRSRAVRLGDTALERVGGCHQ